MSCNCYLYATFYLFSCPDTGGFHLRASNLGTTFAMVTMIVGIWIAVIYFIGYFGTAIEHFGLLRGFITLLSLILILETGEETECIIYMYNYYCNNNRFFVCTGRYHHLVCIHRA